MEVKPYGLTVLRTSVTTPAVNAFVLCGANPVFIDIRPDTLNVDKYTWIDVGSNYRLSEILAAFLYAQFEAREQIQCQRQHLWECYYTGLQTWARSREVQLPHIPLHCEQMYHLFCLVLPSPKHRQHLMAHLRTYGIAGTWHYLPLHLSEMGRRFGGRKGECPVTEAVSERLLRLPFYTDLTAEDQQRVIETIESVE